MSTETDSQLSIWQKRITEINEEIDLRSVKDSPSNRSAVEELEKEKQN